MEVGVGDVVGAKLGVEDTDGLAVARGLELAIADEVGEVEGPGKPVCIADGVLEGVNDGNVLTDTEGELVKGEDVAGEPVGLAICPLGEADGLELLEAPGFKVGVTV